MLEPRYRIQTDSGLSAEYTLDSLRDELAKGALSAGTQCTVDDGVSWVSVLSLVADDSPAASNVSSPSDSTKTSVESAATMDAGASTRRLKRLQKTEGESRFARRHADRQQRPFSDKSSGSFDLVGAELAKGRYVVKSMLGKGSMAYVFLVSDQRLETDAVVKVPKPEKFTTADFRDRFKRECQLLVRFSHPHVVKVLDVGEHGPLPYVVMQLLSGGSLTDRMARESDAEGRMSPESLKSWVREVGRALDFCFRKGMVHRDIKPANILFDDDNNPYVADFGLSKVMYGEHEDLNSSETAAGIVLGTPNYISPEIVLGQPYDGRADQYSLGITIYHALTGKAPMQGNSATATMVNQTQTVLDLLSDVRPDVVSQPLAKAIRKGIEKNPKNRFASCEEFADAVLEGLRVPPGNTAVAVAPVAKSRTKALQSKPTASSKARPASTGSSGQKSGPPAAPNVSKKKRAPVSSLAPDMEWFDLSDDDEALSSASSQAKRRPQRPATRNALPPTPGLPPRKGGSKRKTKSSSKKSTSKNGAGLFGMNVHPAVAVGITAALMLILVVVIVRRFVIGDEADLVADTVAVAVDPAGSKLEAESHAAKSPNDRKKKSSKQRESEPEPQSDSVPERLAAASVDQRPPSEMSGDNTVSESLPESVQVAMAGTIPLSAAAGESSTSPSSVVPVEEELTGRSRFPSIPFESSEGFTVGVANCPIVLSGNRVWDKSTEAVRHRLEGTFEGHAQTALSPNGRLFAAASRPPDQKNTAVIVWDTQSGKQLFTAAGDSQRFADVILLSETSLYIGDRSSEELLAWNCETGKKQKSIRLNESKFRRGNTAISQDGRYIAAMAQGRMVILNTADGNLGGLMQNPVVNVRMKRGSLNATRSLRKSKTPGAGGEAEPVFAAMQSLAFSMDNQELAGFSTFPRSRFMAWNSSGGLTADRAAAALTSGTSVSAFQWFDTKDAWLVSGSILDRNTGRVVLTTLSDYSKGTATSVYDDDHLVGVLRNSPNELSIIPIPWDVISQTLPKIQDVDSALLAVGSHVSIQLQLWTMFEQGSPEVDSVRKALRDTLVREGLKVDSGRPMTFRIAVAKTPEQKDSILHRLTPLDQRSELPTVELAPDGDCLVLELLTSSEATEPIWRVNLGALTDLGLADTSKRVAADKLIKLIDEVNIPYYIPRDENAVGLPIVVD